MKLATYNVNSVRARRGLLLQWLEKRNDIDVLCLQELKVPEEEFPFAEFAGLGYDAAVFAQPQYNGVAICSRLPVKQKRVGFQDDHWDAQKRFVKMQIGDCTVINVYVPHGSEPESVKYRYKLEWLAYFEEYLRRHHSPQEPLIVAGDFNVAIEDRDVFGGNGHSIGTTLPERTALERIFAWGLVDAFRHLYPEEVAYTWWNYIGGKIWKDEGMRIDCIYCTQPLLAKLTEVEVDLWPRRRRKPTPSDHAPVVATFSG